MKTGLRWFRVLPMAALVLFTCAATARPLLVPPQNLALPPQLATLFYYSVAIDSGTLLAAHARSTHKAIQSTASISSTATPRADGPTRVFSPNNGPAT